jgi:hypothetical protein
VAEFLSSGETSGATEGEALIDRLVSEAKAPVEVEAASPVEPAISSAAVSTQSVIDNLTAPETPETPETPATPATPETPATPAASGSPETPSSPGAAKPDSGAAGDDDDHDAGVIDDLLGGKS